jgi:hypothetical protein
LRRSDEPRLIARYRKRPEPQDVFHVEAANAEATHAAGWKLIARSVRAR